MAMKEWHIRQRQTLPLEAKIKLSKGVIEEWYNHWDGNIYVSFSGGKDSTVLLHIVRSMYPTIPAVFCDTGLEFPEIKEFVKSIDNVTIIRPEKSFRKVIEEYGWPIISKEQAQYIEEYRNTSSDKLKNLRWNGRDETNQGKISEKWKFLVNAPFKISPKCCDILKKRPFKLYEKVTGNMPIIGNMASESSKRLQEAIKFSCNAFSCKRPISRPLTHWIDEDIWKYIEKFDVSYSKIYDIGYKRTGCVFCGFGIHTKDPKWKRLENTHPKLYYYCINNLGFGDVMRYIFGHGSSSINMVNK